MEAKYQNQIVFFFEHDFEIEKKEDSFIRIFKI